MRLGEILVGLGYVTVADVQRATERQRQQGGRLGENLIALGVLTVEQLDRIMHEAPAAPHSMAECGVSPAYLLALMLKFMHEQGWETVVDLAWALKLSGTVVQELVQDAIQRKLLTALGTVAAGLVSHIRYGLSERGREAALEALAHDLYIGPAPISLAAYQAQIMKQRITNESLDSAALRAGFADLVVPDRFLRKMGPAVNAGRTVLLFGPAGNGKTAIATRVGEIFKHVIYVPYALEIDGEILQIFDESVHKPPVTPSAATALADSGVTMRREDFDLRWVACKRPVVFAGGELTLTMLDLKRHPEAKYYEAPLHVKALNGIFIIDDFGRQQVSPTDLLNRWIVPLESRVDYLKLATGRSFQIPFDELLIFSTNLAPADLMDPAFLRRIPYKIQLHAPQPDEYRRIFENVARASGLHLTDEIFRFVLEELTVRQRFHLAYYQPKFICEQVVATCKYEGVPPSFTLSRVVEALSNLYVEIAERYAEQATDAAYAEDPPRQGYPLWLDTRRVDVITGAEPVRQQE